MKRRAVFLDRDGVINRAVVRAGKPYPPSSLKEVEVLPGVHDALQRLKDHGYLLVVVSNQPDVARGTTSLATVQAINGFLEQQLCLDKWVMCYHDTQDNCRCRKPRPGMLLDAAEELAIDLSQSFMVGDRWRDVSAGLAAGCKTVFIDYHYDEKRPEQSDYLANSLPKAVDIILEESERWPK